MPTPAPQRAKRAAAQITEQSRVGKLACQRGGEGCSVAARRRTSVGRSPKGAPRTCATRSRVQIYATVTFVAVFFCFLGGDGRDFPTPAPQRAERAAAQITEQSRVDKLACQRGGEGCSVAARRRTSVGRSPRAHRALAPHGVEFKSVTYVAAFFFNRRKSEAPPTCIKTSTRLGAKWLTLYEKYDIINSPINKNLTVNFCSTNG